jgi:ABC-type polysaccharide/polyol phosphate export permease
MDFELTESLDREEMAKEITARLAVRRKFYRAAFVMFAVVVIIVTLLLIWSSPEAYAYGLAWAASAIIGTGAVLWVAYVARRSRLYEEAGRHLLDGK